MQQNFMNGRYKEEMLMQLVLAFSKTMVERCSYNKTLNFVIFVKCLPVLLLLKFGMEVNKNFK